MGRFAWLRHGLMAAGALVLCGGAGWLARTTGGVAFANPAPPPSGAGAMAPLTNMVAIKAGSFLRIRYPVTLTRDYWIARYEVTQGEFAALMGRNPSHFTGDTHRPVEKVSFADAERFCTLLTAREREARRIPAGYEYRLPTEAEWEYACRAGTTNLFSFGDDQAAAESFAWTAENSKETTHPVGQKKPNPWGLHDMHGNVWEWTADWYGPHPAQPVTDPVGAATNKFKIFKGGGWNQDAEYARSANRFGMAPHTGIHFVGFRVVLGPELPGRKSAAR
ncbi:MAG: formylglycine-generating enzyme family protein [Verrucomicrobia bacterium]|nr:formylglycine-generating enzyme family protein [Verrucomicrobiota bacterium]